MTQFGGEMAKRLSIEPIQKVRVSQRVALQICNMIRDGDLSPGDSFSFTFDRPGTYTYFCSIHPNMKGTIVVQG